MLALGRPVRQDWISYDLRSYRASAPPRGGFGVSGVSCFPAVTSKKSIRHRAAKSVGTQAEIPDWQRQAIEGTSELLSVSVELFTFKSLAYERLRQGIRSCRPQYDAAPDALDYPDVGSATAASAVDAYGRASFSLDSGCLTGRPSLDVRITGRRRCAPSRPGWHGSIIPPGLAASPKDMVDPFAQQVVDLDPLMEGDLAQRLIDVVRRVERLLLHIRPGTRLWLDSFFRRRCRSNGDRSAEIEAIEPYPLLHYAIPVHNCERLRLLCCTLKMFHGQMAPRA
jgi:hypothetical protein